MTRKFLLAAILALVFAGCSSQSPEELERLMKKDPDFQKLISTRNRMHENIEGVRKEMLLRKKAMDREIEILKVDYKTYVEQQKARIRKYESSVEAGRNALKREAETDNALLTAKITELEGYKKTRRDVEKVLEEGKGIHLSESEQNKWQERMLQLEAKILPLTEEIEKLKMGIRLKKRKLAYLK